MVKPDASTAPLLNSFLFDEISMQYIGKVQCTGRREMDLCGAVSLIENKPAAAGAVAACRAHARG